MKKQTRKIMGKTVSLLLAAMMLLTAQGMPVLAATAEQESPDNPVHHCTKLDDGSDYTDWSYIYFGSYPQTEVTTSELTTSIIDALYDINGDAWVNGTKYRRISKGDTNYDEYFGRSPYRYFKWERIKWRVLENNGNELFIMADKGLDCQRYNKETIAATWEACTLRHWLNRDFYRDAFSSSEQQAIVRKLVPEDTPDDSKGDNICLLSYVESISPKYGFCDNCNVLSASRWVKPSDYGHAMGAYIQEENDMAGYGNCHWWLKPPSGTVNTASTATAGSSGNSHWFGFGGNLFVRYIAVVPVLHIDLSSGLWSMTDDGINGEENSEDEQNIKVGKLSISAISKKIAAGQKVTLEVAVSPQNASNSKVKWKTGNPKYATVNSRGVVTTKRAGKGKKVKITAEAMDGSGKKAAIELKLMKNAVTKVQIGEVKKPLKAGKTMTLKAKIKTNGKDVNKTLKWSVSNEKYASVNAKGKVTARKAGKGKTVTVTAMSTDGTGKKAKVRIKIR